MTLTYKIIQPDIDDVTEQEPYYIKHCGIKGFAVRQWYKGVGHHHIAYFNILPEAKEYVKWKNNKHKRKKQNND